MVATLHLCRGFCILVCAFCGHRCLCLTRLLAWPYPMAVDNTPSCSQMCQKCTPCFDDRGAVMGQAEVMEFNNTPRKRPFKEKELRRLHCICVLLLWKGYWNLCKLRTHWYLKISLLLSKWFSLSSSNYFLYVIYNWSCVVIMQIQWLKNQSRTS